MAKSYTRVLDPETRRMLYAHRLIYEQIVAHGMMIPKGLMILHRCDNPPCFRPEHLMLGDATTNMCDMVEKGRHFLHGAAKCRPGLHDRTPDNLYTDKRGIQHCRECMRERQRHQRAKVRQRAATSV